MIWNIRTSYVFQKDYKGLPRDIQVVVLEVISSLSEDPFQSFLCTHPLREKLAGYYACSVNEDYRIILRISNEKKLITLMDVGKHEIYKRY